MGRRPSNKPTSFDIAYLAGVSQPTVSRALDRKSTRLNSSHITISYAVLCL